MLHPTEVVCFQNEWKCYAPQSLLKVVMHKQQQQQNAAKPELFESLGSMWENSEFSLVQGRTYI